MKHEMKIEESDETGDKKGESDEKEEGLMKHEMKIEDKKEDSNET